MEHARRPGEGSCLSPHPRRAAKSLFTCPVPNSQLAAFYTCTSHQAEELRQRTATYVSPALSDVRDEVRRLLQQRGLRVKLVVFWGRERYVRILW